MTKALFLDVDGTLISFETHEVPASALDALRRAHARAALLAPKRSDLSRLSPHFRARPGHAHIFPNKEDIPHGLQDF